MLKEAEPTTFRGDWNCAVGDYYKALNILETKPASVRYERKIIGWLDKLLTPITEY